MTFDRLMVVISLVVFAIGVAGYLVLINAIIPDNVAYIPVIMAMFAGMMYLVVLVVGSIGMIIHKDKED